MWALAWVFLQSLRLVRFDQRSTREATVIGREYFERQAAILFKFAKATTDPKISAALLDKAADLKLQVDENGAPDLTPLAPDVEPPPAT
jgi:hypothetical protein